MVCLVSILGMFVVGKPLPMKRDLHTVLFVVRHDL